MHSVDPRRAGSELAAHWGLDPEVVFLNHGSFGACPRPVLEEQERLRRLLEAEPVRFLHRELEPRLDEARRALGEFIGADPEGLVFVPNVTAGVNTVLRSLDFGPGDELVVTDQEYNACRNILDAAAIRTGARVVSVTLPLPVDGPEAIIAALLPALNARTRLLLIDHVTSQTALILPVERIAEECHARGIDLLVDGAHAPGMIPLSLDSLGVAYYTGNCHKWLCAPKGAGFLHVREDRRDRIRPLAISHGANSVRTDRPFLRLEFDWTGTFDPTPYLAVPAAIRFLGSVRPGGWAAVMAENRRLALAARDLISSRLAAPPQAPPEMTGSMAILPLPDGRHPLHPQWVTERLQNELFERDGIETVIIPWPVPSRRWVRVSAQLYNRLEQFDLLAERIEALLHAGF